MRKMSIPILLLLAGVFSVASAAPPIPPGQPPQLWLAKASEVDGKIIIQSYEPRPGNIDEHPSADTMVWEEMQPVTLGETVQAYDVHGEPLDVNSILDLLEEPAGVAVFVRLFPFDPEEPPEFYLSLLSEGTVVLVADAEDIRGIPIP